MIEALRQYLQGIFGDSGLSWASFLTQNSPYRGRPLFSLHKSH